MARQFVNTLTDGVLVDEVYLLADKQLRANRNADLYLLAQLRDRTGQVSAFFWNISESQVAHLQPGGYVHARGKTQLYQGNIQVILTRIDSASEIGLQQADFVQTTNQDTDRLLVRLKEILLGIDEPALRGLMECFLDDPAVMDPLSKAPAGIRLHHAYHGGLLEHIVNLLETIVRIADLYPKVDSRLLLVGAFLHDIGKIRELTWDPTFGYSDEGQLLGHLVIGVEMFDSKVREFSMRFSREFPDELSLRIRHMILSHHGSYEHGSARLPMTPEAIALHHLDNLDAKVNEFATLIQADPNSQSAWTPFHANMQRKIYKGSGTT
jgi:3'-5' exoribonuclease